MCHSLLWILQVSSGSGSHKQGQPVTMGIDRDTDAVDVCFVSYILGVTLDDFEFNVTFGSPAYYHSSFY